MSAADIWTLRELAIGSPEGDALTELLRCAEILAGLQADDGGRSFPTEEDCAFARGVLAKATGGAA